MTRRIAVEAGNLLASPSDVKRPPLRGRDGIAPRRLPAWIRNSRRRWVRSRVSDAISPPTSRLAARGRPSARRRRNPAGSSPSGTTNPGSPHIPGKSPPSGARQRSRRPPRSTRTSATTIEMGFRRGTRAGNSSSRPPCRAGAPRRHRASPRSAGRRGRHAVAPSSMSAWFRSPGRSRSSSAAASDVQAPDSPLVNGDRPPPGRDGTAPGRRCRPPPAPGSRRRCWPLHPQCKGRSPEARAGPPARRGARRAARSASRAAARRFRQRA